MSERRERVSTAPVRRCQLIGGMLALLLLALAPTSAAAQAWRAEQARLQDVMEKVIESAREKALSGSDAGDFGEELSRLMVEYVEKVIKPALREAKSCRERMEAIELAIAIERQAQLLGSSLMSADELTSLMAGAYTDDMYEQCMNELYRACVVEDNPLYTRTMTAWVLSRARQHALLGVEDLAADLLEGRELDPRITKCRGPWYQVSISVEKSGYDAELGGPWHDRDTAEGWLGRGLNLEPPRPDARPYLGDFTRRAEQRDYGARCPDGDCGGNCGFVAVAEGIAAAEYETESSGAYRIISLAFHEDEMEERLEQNSCPHDDVPIAFSPGYQYSAHFPADPLTPVIDAESLPTADADPKLTDALNEWLRMFPSAVVDLEIDGEPIGRLEVKSICDGQEIWSGGSAECVQRWRDYLELYGYFTPLAPWER